jgi:hypothetical protein
MRTESVRVVGHRVLMRNLTTTEMLVRDRQHRLEDAANRYRLAHQAALVERAPLRAGAGWMLVRAGLRLAQVDPLSLSPSPRSLA